MAEEESATRTASTADRWPIRSLVAGLSGRVWGAGAGLPGEPHQDNKPRYALPQF